jgi:hypothetical protein
MQPIDRVRLALLRGRTWRYLRYIHFRNTISQIAHEIETVCVAGAGHGLAELAVALEFPHLRFTLTDIIAKGYPNYHGTMDLCWRYGVDNMAFSVWNVLQPTSRRFDLICSTEMLEHVPDAPLAARNMKEAAKKYVYCLVPYSDGPTNNNLADRERAWERNEHFVFGYDEVSLSSLFGEPTHIAGTYWADAGLQFRKRLTNATNEEINRDYRELTVLAETDIRVEVPKSLKEAQGIKILSRADAPTPASPNLPPTLEQLRKTAPVGPS